MFRNSITQLQFKCVILFMIYPIKLTKADVEYEKVYQSFACEASEMHLQCSGKDVLAIVWANYGRTSASVCNLQEGILKFENCYDPKSSKKVIKNCTFSNECHLKASDEVFGDKCPYVYKYLHVVYRCISQEDAKKIQEDDTINCSYKQDTTLLACYTIFNPKPDYLYYTPFEQTPETFCKKYEEFKECMTAEETHCPESKYLSQNFYEVYDVRCSDSVRKIQSSNEECLYKLQTSEHFGECRSKYSTAVTNALNNETAFGKCEYMEALVELALCVKHDIFHYCAEHGKAIFHDLLQYKLEKLKEKKCISQMKKLAKNTEVQTVGMTCPEEKHNGLVDCEATKEDYKQFYLWDTTPLTYPRHDECENYRKLMKCIKSNGPQCLETGTFGYFVLYELFYEYYCNEMRLQLLEKHQQCVEKVTNSERFFSCRRTFQDRAIGLFESGGDYWRSHDNNCTLFAYINAFSNCILEKEAEVPECVGIEQVLEDLREYYRRKYLWSHKCSVENIRIVEPVGHGIIITICQDADDYLKCSADRVIQIVNVQYGRTNNIVCQNSGHGTVNRECYDSNSDQMEWVQKKCNGESRCYVRATDREYGSYCKGISKYLTVTYSCENPDELHNGGKYIEYTHPAFRSTMANDETPSPTQSTFSTRAGKSKSRSNSRSDEGTDSATDSFSTPETHPDEDHDSTTDSESTRGGPPDQDEDSATDSEPTQGAPPDEDADSATDSNFTPDSESLEDPGTNPPVALKHGNVVTITKCLLIVIVISIFMI